MRLDGLRIRGLEVLISVLSVSVPKQITLPPCVPSTRLMKGLHSTAQILRGSRLTEQRRRPERLEGGYQPRGRERPVPPPHSARTGTGCSRRGRPSLPERGRGPSPRAVDARLPRRESEPQDPCAPAAHSRLHGPCSRTSAARTRGVLPAVPAANTHAPSSQSESRP